MKAVPSIREANRFLDTLFSIAEKEGQAGSATLWIDPRESEIGWRAIRRGLCLAAIRAANDHTLGPDIFGTYPGTSAESTEDQYCAACLRVFKQQVQQRAQAAAVRVLNNQELVVGNLQLSLAQDVIARRLTESARKALKVGRLIGAPAQTGEAPIPALTFVEMKAVVAYPGSRGTVDVRLRRTIYMREVNKTGDRLLIILMKLPNGVQIVDKFGEGPAEGRQIALSSLQPCAEAILGLRASLIADATEVWKYPPALAQGAVATAKEAGQEKMAYNLTRIAFALAAHERSAAESVVGVLNKAVLCLLLLGPVGAIAADILSVVVSVMEGAINVLKELNQDQAMQASTFADDGDRLSSGGKVAEAAVKGVLSIAAAVAPVGVANIVGRASRAERAAEDVGAAVITDTRAVKRPIEGGDQIDDVRRGLRTEAGHATRGHYEDLSHEWPGGPQRDPRSVSKAEIQQAKKDVVEDFKKSIRYKEERDRAMRALDYVDMAGTPAQKETFGRLTGRTFGKGTLGGPPRSATPERADLLRQAESWAANLRRRLKVHWDAALPNRGNQTAEQAAAEIFADVAKETTDPSKAGSIIREKLFSRWRGRFLTRVANDTQLVEDLRTQARVVFNPTPGKNGNAFGVPFRDTQGNIELVGLDIDHAVIRHEDAVTDAFRTHDSRKLLATINSDGLQLLTERENRSFIETPRQLNREMWDYPSDRTRDAANASIKKLSPAHAGSRPEN